MKYLKKQDPRLYKILKNELARQKEGIDLIASENYVSYAVMEAASSPLTNKYSEGYPKKRYYAGNRWVDEVESLAIERAKKLFCAEHVNVQPHSGSQANQAVYMALLKPGDKVLGIDLSCGGHLSHGSPVNFSGKFYNFVNYGVNRKTEQLDYGRIEKIAQKEQPKLIICGTTAYPRIIDFKKFGIIAKKVNAYLMGDIAHIAGLIIAGLHPHPFPHCDVVTSTTHKTLCGPRGGLILSRIKDRLDPQGKLTLAQKIDKAIFPGIQGGPLEHIIAAKAVCFLEASRLAFKIYQKNIVKNAQAMASEFIKEHIRLVSGGTDNHLILIDLTKHLVSSTKIQQELEKVGIFVNRNTIPYDARSPFDPSGIRVGTPAISSRGFKENDCRLVAHLVSNIIKNFGNKKIATQVKKEVLKLTKKYPIYENLKW